MKLALISTVTIFFFFCTNVQWSQFFHWDLTAFSEYLTVAPVDCCLAAVRCVCRVGASVRSLTALFFPLC